MNFDQAFERLIGHEGGYAFNPSDPGGETMFGVTARVARANGYRGDMRFLTLETAKAIARAEYWDACRCEEMPERMRYSLFDASYNSGPKQAIKWLQRAVGVDDDGLLGAVTMEAAQRQEPDLTVRVSVGERLVFLADLPTWYQFGKGWARRLAAILQEA